MADSMEPCTTKCCGPPLVAMATKFGLGAEIYRRLPACLYVCLYVCRFVTNIASFLFLDGIEPFLGHQFSMTKTTKHCSSIFDLGPLTPKIYSPLQNLHKIAYKSACMADRA